MTDPTFTLGFTLKDTVTGFTGIATARISSHSGSVQYALQPKAKGDKVPEALYFDEQRLEKVKVKAKPCVECGKQLHPLGTRVKDMASELVGIVVAEVEYISGCRHSAVLPLSKDGKVENWCFIDEKRLEKVDDGLVKVPAKKTGGPSFRQSDMRSI